jgi:hypothetical protein
MKDLIEFQELIPHVRALWQELSSQNPRSAAQIARKFIDRMTGTMFFEGWEFQFQRHGTILPPNEHDQIQPRLADAENAIAERLIGLVMGPSVDRLKLAIQACEHFLIELDVELTDESQIGAENPSTHAKQFAGGPLVFFQDRVELCGVDICSGERSNRKRKILDLLRKRNHGFFVAYSGKMLTELMGGNYHEGEITGLIRDLRGRIAESLREIGIECGRNDVILSGGPGYRFSDKLSVQLVGRETEDDDQAHPARTDDPDDPKSSDPNDPKPGDPDDAKPGDDPDPGDADGLDFDNATTQRRAWILAQLAAGRDVRPNDVVGEFGCSKITAKRDFQALKAERRIDFDGSRRSGKYYLLEPPVQAED